ncbi:MAG TPA: precorrin-3B synthase, partial [Streptosporangiaceae bacterium]
MPATSPAADRAADLAVDCGAADRCPGVLRLAEAADGYLARIRLPGGMIDAEQMRVLERLASEFGDGRMELTSRGNVQMRALAPVAASPLTEELTRAGLLPSLSHDRVRNVLASPLAGVDGGPDLTGIVRALDAALCARPRLAELPGRFLFAVDDGRGDVAGLGADVTARLGKDGVVVNGLAIRGPEDGVVAAMLACAEAFLDEAAAQGGKAWRIADLTDGDERVRAAVAARLGLAAAPEPTDAGSRAPTRPVGLVGTDCTAAVLLAPLGRLTSAQLTWLADQVTGRPARITPWRSVVIPDLSAGVRTLAEAARLGFGVDDAS